MYGKKLKVLQIPTCMEVDRYVGYIVGKNSFGKLDSIHEFSSAEGARPIGKRISDKCERKGSRACEKNDNTAYQPRNSE